MRLLKTGVDSSGCSCVIERSEPMPVEAPGAEGLAVARLFFTDRSPLPPCPPGTTRHTDKALAPGQISCHLIEHGPRRAGEELDRQLHYGDAIDIVTILEGGGEMRLCDGDHPLGVGDVIVMPGVDHVFRQGPNGCRMMVFAIGTPPAKGDQLA